MSEEKCIIINADAPVITNVSVMDTDIFEGKVELSWVPPFEIDTILFPKPYSYRVNRLEGFSSDVNLSKSDILLDTFYIDTKVNTLEKVYNYIVEVFSGLDTSSFESSYNASTVRLELNGKQNNIELSWDFNVPWSNSCLLYTSPSPRDS